MNVGYRPVSKKGVPALEPSRLSHVFQNYFRPETIGPANRPMVTRQAAIPLAQAWGGGLVPAVDGMRFVVPVPSVFARPNRKFFGPKRGMTWLNAINDQGVGRGAKVVSGTVRDSLHMVRLHQRPNPGSRSPRRRRAASHAAPNASSDAEPDAGEAEVVRAEEAVSASSAGMALAFTPRLFTQVALPYRNPGNVIEWAR